MAGTDARKVAIIGCGRVGAACAFSLMQSGLFTKMVLIDEEEGAAEGEALDIGQGRPFVRPMAIRAGSYDDISDASVVIVAPSASQEQGESDATRADRVRENVLAMKTVMEKVRERRCRGVMLIVSDPVDVLTQVAVRYSGMPEHRVIGLGTVLDSYRLKLMLAEQLGVDSRSVHAFTIGEQGGHEFAAWSCANVFSIPLRRFCEMRGFTDHEKEEERIAAQARESARTIAKKKGSACFGIAMAVKRVCKAIVRDEQSVLTVSSMQRGRFGIDGVVLSMPATIGSNGLEDLAPIDLNDDEQAKLRESARIVRETVFRELGDDASLPGSTHKGAVDFRFLSSSDKTQLDALIGGVEANLPDDTWWPPIRQELRDHFFDPEWARFIGCFDRGRLTATGGLFLNPFAFKHLAEAIELDPDDVVEIGRCMVRPTRRGSNLMLTMCNQLVDCAMQLDKSWLIAAVHPDNIAGTRSLEQLGMSWKGSLLQDEVYPREIYAMRI